MPVEVVGAVQLREALKRYAPDLSKELQKEIGGYLKPVVNKARSYVPDRAPLSGWGLGTTQAYAVNYRPFPKFYAPKMKHGISYTTVPSKPNKKGFVYLARIYNASAPGAIYEAAGRLHPNGRVVAQDIYRKQYGNPYGVDPRKPLGIGRDFKSLNPFASIQFINALPPIVKGPQSRGRPSRKMNGRLIFRAWAETHGQVVPKVLAAMVSAKDKFNLAKAA